MNMMHLWKSANLPKTIRKLLYNIRIIFSKYHYTFHKIEIFTSIQTKYSHGIIFFNNLHQWYHFALVDNFQDTFSKIWYFILIVGCQLDFGYFQLGPVCEFYILMFRQNIHLCSCSQLEDYMTFLYRQRN